MATDWTKEHLNSLTKASEEAIKRLRYVFILINIAGVIILAAQFNVTFSWLRRVESRNQPKLVQESTRLTEVQQIARQVLQRDLYVTSIPVLGIKFSAFDLSVVGSFALMVLAIWYYMTAQRENIAIKTVSIIGLEKLKKDDVEAAEKQRDIDPEITTLGVYLLDSVQHYFVLQPLLPHSRFIQRCVNSTIFMPVWIPLIVLLCDIISLARPAIASSTSLWCTLTPEEHLEINIRFIITLLMVIVSASWCKKALKISSKTHADLSSLYTSLQKRRSDLVA